MSKYLEPFKHFKVKYSLGNFVFLFERIDNFDLPLINFNTKFKDKNIEKIYSDALKEEGIGKIGIGVYLFEYVKRRHGSF